MRPAVALLALFALARTAAAEDVGVVTKRVGFAERGPNLTLSTSFTEILDGPTYEKMSSGFPTTIAVRIYVYRSQRTDKPVSLSLLELEVVYDLWDEVYIIRSRGPLGETRLRARSRSQAVQALTELDEMPVAPLDRIAIGPHHFVALVIELNPISPELRAEMRRLMSRPAGESALDSSSSFFGSFVSVFANPKIERADRILRIRSQPFYRTPR